MPKFKCVEAAEAVDYIHPDLGGESRRSFEVGDTVEAAANPDPSRFDEVAAKASGHKGAPADKA